MTWAPSVLATGGGYVMYVATEEASSGRQCISAATSPTPGGPYTDPSSSPFLCQRQLGGSIDPTVVRDAKGGLHLVWKNDGNCCNMPTALWEQDLERRRPAPARQPPPPRRRSRLGGRQRRGAGDDSGHPRLVAVLLRRQLADSVICHRPGLVRDHPRPLPHHALSQPLLPSTAQERTPSGLDTFLDASGHRWAAFTTTVLIPSRHRHRFYANRVLTSPR